MRARIGALASIVALGAAAGCPAPRHPAPPRIAPVTLEVGRAGYALRGVAGDADRLYAAFAPLAGDHTCAPLPGAARPGEAGPCDRPSIVEARRGAAVVWSAKLDGTVGPLAAVGPLVVATISQGPPALRGQPGAALDALDAATGQPRWRVALDATDWAVIATIAPAPDGVLVGGSFAGTLRAADHVVSTAGRSDGFVAKLTPAGAVAWLVRLGGPGADAVLGVAAAQGKVAIAGTFAAGAELGGVPLPPYNPRSPFADAFAASLDPGGARVWSATFGGKDDDAVAGIAVDTAGRYVVAATARDTVDVGSSQLAVQGAADGLVAWINPDGTKGPAVLIGGLDFDGLRAIAPVGDHVVVGGFFSGRMDLAGRTVTAGGGDDSFLAVLDGSGAVTDAWQVGGEGREEIVQLATIPGGFVAGVAHTAAARVGETALPSPADPMTGAALVVRPAP